jgi:Uma2 family endonuclease
MEALIKERKSRKLRTKPLDKNKTLEEYFVLESKNESNQNFEFNNGIIEKKRKMMTLKQTYIYHNIADWVVTNGYFEKGFRLYAEKEFRIGETKVRIPDMVLLSKENVKGSIHGFNVIPDLLIEVVSENDSLKNLEYKLIEYFDAGVKCVWAVIPDIELVYVYSSARQVIIYSEKQMCTAKPAVDFEIITQDIFKK